MQKNQIQLIQGDCLEQLHQLYVSRGTFVDLIFCDPPYFLSNGGISCQNGQMVSVNKGDWDRSKGKDTTHAFNLKWLKLCQKITETKWHNNGIRNIPYHLFSRIRYAKVEYEIT